MDDLFSNIAEHLPSGRYYEFCSALDIEYGKANAELDTCLKECNQALKGLLSTWKNRLPEDTSPAKVGGKMCPIVEKYQNKVEQLSVQPDIDQLSEEPRKDMEITLGFPAKLRIGLFGTPGVGKSALINSLRYAFNGLLCLKYVRVTTEITDVINTKRSDLAEHSNVRNIKGKECLVQLMKAFDSKTKALDGRYDVITLTTADVKLGDNVYPSSVVYDDYKEHRGTWCKGCSQQVGWYFEPENTQSAPFHALWLQCLIHDSYDSDNSLNAFFAKNRIEE